MLHYTVGRDRDQTPDSSRCHFRYLIGYHLNTVPAFGQPIIFATPPMVTVWKRGPSRPVRFSVSLCVSLKSARRGLKKEFESPYAYCICLPVLPQLSRCPRPPRSPSFPRPRFAWIPSSDSAEFLANVYFGGRGRSRHQGSHILPL